MRIAAFFKLRTACTVIGICPVGRVEALLEHVVKEYGLTVSPFVRRGG
jgi:hypothetical protein